MTVKELIEKLKEFDQDMIVYLSDSEYGVEEFNDEFSIERVYRYKPDGLYTTRYEVDVLVLK